MGGETRNNGYPSGEDEEVGEEITGGHSHLVGHQSLVPAELLWLCWEHVFTEEWGSHRTQRGVHNSTVFKSK